MRKFQGIKNLTEWEEKQHLWTSAKAVLRGTYAYLKALIRKEEKSAISNLDSHLKSL